MDWTIILINLFGPNSLEFYISFYLMAFLGMEFVMLAHHHYTKNQKEIKTKLLKRNFLSRAKKNLIHILVNIIGVFAVIRFNDEIQIVDNLSMWQAFLIGMSIDVIIVLIMNFKISPKTT